MHIPLFLVHDNIFDVDQDTLVQCLNYIYKQEEHALKSPPSTKIPTAAVMTPIKVIADRRDQPSRF